VHLVSSGSQKVSAHELIVAPVVKTSWSSRILTRTRSQTAKAPSTLARLSAAESSTWSGSCARLVVYPRRARRVLGRRQRRRSSAWLKPRHLSRAVQRHRHDGVKPCAAVEYPEHARCGRPVHNPRVAPVLRGRAGPLEAEPRPFALVAHERLEGRRRPAARTPDGLSGATPRSSRGIGGSSPASCNRRSAGGRRGRRPLRRRVLRRQPSAFRRQRQAPDPSL
jgi:hypothetical protein